MAIVVSLELFSTVPSHDDDEPAYPGLSSVVVWFFEVKTHLKPRPECEFVLVNGLVGFALFLLLVGHCEDHKQAP